MKTSVALLLFSLINMLQDFNDRRIIVLSADDLNSEVKEQIDKLRKNPVKLEERKLAVFTLIDGEVTSIFNASKNSKAFVENNKKSYPTSSSIRVFLIGLDRTVKQSFSEVIEPRKIFEIIDSMPMRQAEMRRN
jgi:hypothetical protein